MDIVLYSDEQLVQRLPLPLAQLYRHAHNAKTPLERHNAAYCLWEAALKLLGTVAVAEFAALENYDPKAFFRLKERRDRLLTAIVSGIGAGMFAKEIVESFRAMHVMNAYDWAIALFKTPGLPVDKLKQEALKLHQWEIGSIIVVVAFFLIGFLVYWRWGEKIGKE